MGTGLGIVTAGVPRSKVEPLWKSLCNEALLLEKILNRFDPGSEVSSLNHLPPDGEAPLGTLLEAILHSAKTYWERTGGLFDVTGGSMGRVSFPSPGKIRPGGAALDFGGFAKGWFVRRCGEVLDAEGVRNVFLDFGGSTILCRGAHPGGDCWKVSVPDPFTGLPVAEVELRDRTLSTSGNSPGYVGHIVNPLTGARVEAHRLALALSADSLDAEVLSTVLMIADGKQRKELEKEFPDAEMKVIDLT